MSEHYDEFAIGRLREWGNEYGLYGLSYEDVVKHWKEFSNGWGRYSHVSAWYRDYYVPWETRAQQRAHEEAEAERQKRLLAEEQERLAAENERVVQERKANAEMWERMQSAKQHGDAQIQKWQEPPVGWGTQATRQPVEPCWSKKV